MREPVTVISVELRLTRGGFLRLRDRGVTGCESRGDGCGDERARRNAGKECRVSNERRDMRSPRLMNVACRTRNGRGLLVSVVDQTDLPVVASTTAGVDPSTKVGSGGSRCPHGGGP